MTDKGVLALTAAFVAFVAVMALVTAIAHGILRTALEARGVAPWTLKDSIGALPLVLMGSGLSAAALAWLFAMSVAVADGPGIDFLQWHFPKAFNVAAAKRAIAVALVLAGLLQVRLGLVAIRKLF